MKVAHGSCKPIENPVSVPRNLDQSSAAKMRQVARDRRLGQLEDGHQVSHANLIALEQREDSQPRPIGARAECLV